MRQESWHTLAFRLESRLSPSSSVQNIIGSSIGPSGEGLAIGGALTGRPRQSRIFRMASEEWMAATIFMRQNNGDIPTHPRTRLAASARPTNNCAAGCSVCAERPSVCSLFNDEAPHLENAEGYRLLSQPVLEEQRTSLVVFKNSISLIHWRRVTRYQVIVFTHALRFGPISICGYCHCWTQCIEGKAVRVRSSVGSSLLFLRARIRERRLFEGPAAA